MISGTRDRDRDREPSRGAAGRDPGSGAGQARISHWIKAAGAVAITIQPSRCRMAVPARIAGSMAMSRILGHDRTTATATHADLAGGRWS